MLIIYNLMRSGVGYMRQAEAAYAEQVRQRLEKQFRVPTIVYLPTNPQGRLTAVYCAATTCHCPCRFTYTWV